MRAVSLASNQRGFTLLTALFILVVLALLGVFMVTLSSVQSRSSLLAVQGARAYQAAQAGIEWGIAQSAVGVCAASSTFVVEGFSVTVNCLASGVPIVEGAMSYRVYDLSAQASLGSYGSQGFVSRQVAARVTGP